MKRMVLALVVIAACGGTKSGSTDAGPEDAGARVDAKRRLADGPPGMLDAHPAPDARPPIDAGIDASTCKRVRGIAAATVSTCAILADGSISCWGDTSITPFGEFDGAPQSGSFNS